MKYSEIGTEQRLYLSMITSSLLSLLLINMFYSYSLVIVVIILIVQGIVVLTKMYKKFRLLVTPVTIFALVWFIIMPLTSFECPLMERMSKMQWNYCLVGMVCFAVGGFLCASISGKRLQNRTEEKSDWRMSRGLYSLCIWIILFSIMLYFYQAMINGGFPAMAGNVDEARRNFYLPGIAFLSNIGFLAVYLVFCDKTYRKRKVYWFLSAIYIVIQLLMAVRFLLFLIVLMLLSTYGSNPNRTRQLKVFLRIATVLAIAFLIVASMRGGSADKEKYFIATGIYSGSVEELTRTEILRYFGMSQRMMEDYINYYEAGCSVMGHTFYPILDAIGIEPYIPLHYGHYGYTACNIITYFYFDAGALWWVLMIVWSYIMNLWYYQYKHSPESIMNKYLWSLSTISLVMSFYCYVNAYPYWYVHFVVILYLIKNWKLNLLPFLGSRTRRG